MLIRSIHRVAVYSAWLLPIHNCCAPATLVTPLGGTWVSNSIALLLLSRPTAVRLGPATVRVDDESDWPLTVVPSSCSWWIRARNRLAGVAMSRLWWGVSVLYACTHSSRAAWAAAMSANAPASSRNSRPVSIYHSATPKAGTVRRARVSLGTASHGLSGAIASRHIEERQPRHNGPVWGGDSPEH